MHAPTDNYKEARVPWPARDCLLVHCQSNGKVVRLGDDGDIQRGLQFDSDQQRLIFIFMFYTSLWSPYWITGVKTS